MSILNDLDPLNAKIHTPQAAAGSARKIAWLLATLSFLGGSIWFISGIRTGSSAATSDQPAPIEKAATPAGLATATQETTAAPSTPATPTKDESAQIRDNTPAPSTPKPGSEADGNAFQAMRMELAKTNTDQAVSPPSAQTKVQKANREALPQKNAGKASSSPSKSSRNSAPAASGNSSHTAKNEKKPAERDIDIITAIVK